MKGKCLCGTIEVEAPDCKEVGLCHCATCRRWSGGPLFSIHCGKGVSFSGGEPARYRSSEWAERGFCPNCGTHLFYYLLPGDDYVIPAGLFNEAAFELTAEIFIDEKPAYYSFANDTEQLTGQEVFERFSPEA